MVQFDDKETRAERWRMDRFTALRKIFENFNVNCTTLSIPSEYLAIDETLYPYRGMVKLKQYNPSKTAKYGILYQSISDSVVPFIYFTLPYAGKPEVEVSEFYVTGTDEYSLYLVDKLSSNVDITGRNVSVDRYFTTVTITHYLKEKKMTLVGTMSANKKGIPKELVEMQNRDDKDIKFVYANEDDDMMLTSYVAKKKSGKRFILLLSTMHDDVRCSRDERKKPNTICFYDKTKCGVDVADVVIGKYTTKYKTRRWTMNAFAYMLDTVRTNAHTVFKEIKYDIRTFDFIWQLRMLFMNAHITGCLANPVWLHPIDTRRRDDVVIYLFLSRNVVPPYHDVVTTLQKRCRLKDVYTRSLYCC